MEKGTGAAGTDVSLGKGLNGSVEHGQSAYAVEPDGHFNAGLVRAGGTQGAGLEVTEIAAAHGWGLAMESAGQDVTTFGVHGVPSGDRL
jgi:hypothetical protein